MSSARRVPSAGPSFTSPNAAVQALCERLRSVPAEMVSLDGAAGRVLADPLIADRDCPACDVSAMDGYAVRLGDLASRGSAAQPALEVNGEIAIGREPPPLPPGKVLRIFTGAPVPPGAEAVIQREHAGEGERQITLGGLPQAPVAGLNIRRRGENARAGETVAPAGSLVTPALIAGLAGFGATRVSVRHRVRVDVITTGNEVVPPDVQPQPWQIRDSNGPGLRALLSGPAWLEVGPRKCVGDDLDALRRILAETLAECDAVLLTGGVSAGDYDFVPDAVAAVGGETVFHRLPIRPGGPILGAVGPQGRAILGLPGNPVSVLVTARRLAWTVLRHLAGFAEPTPRAATVRLGNADEKKLHLWWFRLVRLAADGKAELVPTRSSGDIVALSRSDGFVEIPPQTSGPGPWPFYSWES